MGMLFIFDGLLERFTFGIISGTLLGVGFSMIGSGGFIEVVLFVSWGCNLDALSVSLLLTDTGVMIGFFFRSLISG